MWWPSTVIGAGAGFAVASIPGALLGALVGQAMDRRLQVRGWEDLRERLGGRPALRDEELLFVLLGRLAKCDGRVAEQHIQQARQEMVRLDLADAARLRAIAAFNRGKAGKDRLAGHLRRIREQPHAAEGTLRACWRMVWADGKVGAKERDLLLDWGQTLGLSRRQVQALSLEYEPRKTGLAPGACSNPAFAPSPTAIRALWRRPCRRPRPYANTRARCLPQRAAAGGSGADGRPAGPCRPCRG